MWKADKCQMERARKFWCGKREKSNGNPTNPALFPLHDSGRRLRRSKGVHLHLPVLHPGGQRGAQDLQLHLLHQVRVSQVCTQGEGGWCTHINDDLGKMQLLWPVNLSVALAAQNGSVAMMDLSKFS